MLQMTAPPCGRELRGAAVNIHSNVCAASGPVPGTWIVAITAGY